MIVRFIYDGFSIKNGSKKNYFYFINSKVEFPFKIRPINFLYILNIMFFLFLFLVNLLNKK